MKTTASTIRHKEAGAMTLRDHGLVSVIIDTNGRLVSCPDGKGDWLADLLCNSELCRRALTQAVSAWDQGHDGPFEAFSGLWLDGTPTYRRRELLGYNVLLVVTDALPGAEHLHAMCQGGGVDYQLISERIRHLPPVAASEVQRICRLAGMITCCTERIEQEEDTIESFGNELSESYEELAMLYSTIERMGEIEHPVQFVRTACRELCETLPYEWVGAVLSTGARRAGSLAGRFIHTGSLPEAPPLLRDAAMRLLEEQGGAQDTIVLTDSLPGLLGVLGKPLVAHPIRTSDGPVGLLLAGGRSDRVQKVSSCDMKLLAATASHTGIFIENAARFDDLEAMLVGTLESLAAAIDAKDPYTCGHSRRVALLSERLATAIGMNEEDVKQVRMAALVHDIGKIGVPERVLSKPGALTDEEFEAMRRHPEIGYRILRDIPRFEGLLPGVLHHHERWDGQGYPVGLAGRDIPLVARVIALADAFDAMSSTRTYRSRIPRDRVLAEIRQCGGNQFDPELVEVFMALDFTGFDALLHQHSFTGASTISLNRGEAA